jgi:hypothetical protein
MLHVFVFPSVTDVIITRHRQNIYLPVYARRRRLVVVAAEAVTLVATDGAVVSALWQMTGVHGPWIFCCACAAS